MFFFDFIKILLKMKILKLSPFFTLKKFKITYNHQNLIVCLNNLCQTFHCLCANCHRIHFGIESFQNFAQINVKWLPKKFIKNYFKNSQIYDNSFFDAKYLTTQFASFSTIIFPLLEIICIRRFKCCLSIKPKLRGFIFRIILCKIKNN